MVFQNYEVSYAGNTNIMEMLSNIELTFFWSIKSVSKGFLPIYVFRTVGDRGLRRLNLAIDNMMICCKMEKINKR